MVELYECDGCGRQGTEAEISAHIVQEGTYPSGDWKPIEQIKCWGYFVVGSEVWRQYHEHGIHPMSNISITAADIALQNGAGKENNG